MLDVAELNAFNIQFASLPLGALLNHMIITRERESEVCLVTSFLHCYVLKV